MINIEFHPDPTLTLPPTPAKLRNPQPKAPRYVPTCIKDTSNNFIKISTEADPNDVVIRGEYDAWYLNPDQAVSVAHAILGYVNEITGDKPRYAVGMIADGEPTVAYIPDDVGPS